MEANERSLSDKGLALCYLRGKKWKIEEPYSGARLVASHFSIEVANYAEPMAQESVPT